MADWFRNAGRRDGDAAAAVVHCFLRKHGFCQRFILFRFLPVRVQGSVFLTEWIDRDGRTTEPMNVGIPVKKLKKDAKLPTAGSRQAAGYDLYACTGAQRTLIAPHTSVLIGTGIACAIPEGYFGAVFARPRKRAFAPQTVLALWILIIVARSWSRFTMTRKRNAV